MQVKLSNHALLQMAERDISEELVLETISNPLTETFDIEGHKIYQQIFIFSDKQYLVRVFVNTLVNPNLVKTVYKTSKISKYYEGPL